MGGTCFANPRVADEQNKPSAACERVLEVCTEGRHFLFTPDENFARGQGGTTPLMLFVA
jgi:hypothetical protein